MSKYTRWMTTWEGGGGGIKRCSGNKRSRGLKVESSKATTTKKEELEEDDHSLKDEIATFSG